MVSNGRGSWIRTNDPLLPKQMRYQTALYPECLTEQIGALQWEREYSHRLRLCKRIFWILGLESASQFPATTSAIAIKASNVNWYPSKSTLTRNRNNRECYGSIGSPSRTNPADQSQIRTEGNY